MKYLSLFLVLATLASCKLDLPEETIDPSAAAVPMEELSIPQGFDFSTTRKVKFSVAANDAKGQRLKNVPFQIFLLNAETQLELQTASTGTNGATELELNIPLAVDKILVKTPYLGLPAEKVVTLGTAKQVDIVLGDENREGFQGGDQEYVQGNFGNGSTASTASAAAVGDRSAVSFSYMGTYNSQGKPNYLLSPNDVVSQDLLDVINASLPEGQPVPSYHPEYLANDLVSTVELVEDAEVWVTFVHEGAGYRNALGYYSYPTENPPTSIDDIDDLKVIFPNVSFNGSGGNLTTGNKVYLGVFSAGTSIGWFLVPDGWNPNSKKVDAKPEIKFADKNLNTFTQAQYRQHTALLYDQSLQKLILGMEDISRPGGDNDFNDAIFYVSANPFTALKTSNLAPAKNSDDDDEDGVNNSVDVEPNNPNVAFYNYTPSQGQFGTLAFEDLFPNKGDYDMNDLVVDYNFKEYLNANNDIVKMDVSLKLRAAGGVQQNGFGLQLGVTPDKIASVTGSQITGNLISIAGNGTESGQDKAVIIAFDNALQLLGGGSIVNTEKEKGSVNPVDLNLQVVFTAPVSREELGTAPFNPFLFVNTVRGKEVHLPGYHPTKLAIMDYLNSGDDVTNPATGVYYQTASGLPFAINIPVSFAYPVERTPINAGHLKFTQWAQSGGAQFADWYKNLNGYRATAKVY
jgi:LruC domain-containing protein